MGLHLQTIQEQPFIYLLENVHPLADSQLQVLMAWDQVHGWLGKPILVDVALMQSHAHGVILVMDQYNTTGIVVTNIPFGAMT